MSETVLQFGAGRFLRGFVDRFIHHANEAGQSVGKVVIVQSTPGKRAELINAHPDGYPAVVRGYADGKVIDHVEHISSVSRALIATEQWDQVLALAKSPELRLIVSNATEAGYVLDKEDAKDASPPATLPAKLTSVLWHRFESGGSPLVLLPCELLQENATRLCELVLQQATKWQLPEPFLTWVAKECTWLNNLVDCIISDLPPDDSEASKNPLTVQVEPYALLAIQKTERKVGLFDHPAIQIVDNLDPYYLRKVRILNGLHTCMVGKFLGTGPETVRDVLNDPDSCRWVKDVAFEEIVPVLVAQVEGAAAFAEATLDRFRNPFLEHLLKNISLNHQDKLKVRLLPTLEEYQSLYGKAPKRIQEAMERQIPVN